MSNEDLSKLWGGNGEATLMMVFLKAYRWKLFKIDQDTNKTISVLERYAGSYSFASLRYLWLLFYGTGKSYHNLEVVLLKEG